MQQERPGWWWARCWPAGLLTRYLGWSAVFFVNVPLALAALVAASVVVPQDPPRDRNRRFDLTGALAAMSSVTLVVWALVQGPELGWSAAPVIVPAARGPASRLGVYAVKRRARDPLIPRALVVNRFVRLAVVLAFLFMATFDALLFFVSIYLQNVLGYNALQTGLGFVVPTTVVVFASSTARPVPRGSGCGRRSWLRLPSVPSAPQHWPTGLTPTPPTSNFSPD